jgi:hypothetical protein
VHVEEDHALEHGIDQLEQAAAGQLSGDVRVSDVQAHARVLAVQAAYEASDGPGVVTHELGPRIDRGEVLDRKPDPELGRAPQRPPQRALLVGKPAPHLPARDRVPRDRRRGPIRPPRRR